MDVIPTPDRLVVRLTDKAFGSGATGSGEIVAIGDEIAETSKLHYAIGDTVVFGLTSDVPVISVDEDDEDLIVLGAGDILAKVSGTTKNVKIVDPAEQKVLSRNESAGSAPEPKLDEYIRQLRSLAK